MRVCVCPSVCLCVLLTSCIDVATVVGYSVVSRPFLDLKDPRHMHSSHSEIMKVRMVMEMCVCVCLFVCVFVCLCVWGGGGGACVFVCWDKDVLYPEAVLDLLLLAFSSLLNKVCFLLR